MKKNRRIKSTRFIFYTLIILLGVSFLPSTTKAVTLLQDDFSTTTINTSNWTEGDTGGAGGTTGNVRSAVSTSGLFIKGTSGWGNNYIKTATSYGRVGYDVSLDTDVTVADCSTSYYPAIGYGRPYDAIVGTPNYIAYYPGGGPFTINYYSNGNGITVGKTYAFACTNNVPFHLKFTVLNTGGYAFYVNSIFAASSTAGTSTGVFYIEQYGSSATSTIFKNIVISDTLVATAPGAPTGLSTTPDNTQMGLSWTAPVSNGGSAITDYLIEYKTSATSTWSTFSHATSTATSTTITSLVNGTSYDFRVAAINAIGTGTSTSVATATPVAGAPGSPTALSSNTSVSGQVDLVWSAPVSDGGSAITDYLIEYKTSATSTWSTFSHATSTATSTTITGLTNNILYDFRVSSININGTSAPSSTVSDTPYSYLLVDRFSTTTIDTTSWVESDSTGAGGTTGKVQQNGTALTVQGVGSFVSQNGLYTTSTYDRTSSNVSIQATVKSSDCSTIGPDFGYGDLNFSSGSAGGAYIVTVVSGNYWIYYWNNGSNVPGSGSSTSPVQISGATCTNNTPITLRMVAKSTGGVEIYVGTSTSIAASSSAGTFTNKSFFLGSNNGSSTTTYDDVKIVGPAGISSAPSGLGGTAGDTQVSLSWSVPSTNGGAAITDYIIQYRTGSDSYATFSDGVSTAVSGTVTGLTNGLCYDFKVAAVNSIGTSLYSSSTNKCPVTATPGVPVVTTVVINGFTNLNDSVNGTYFFYDPNGDVEATSTYKWYRSSTLGGTYTAITGATSSIYNFDSNDVGQYVKFGVIPVTAASSSSTGSEVLSTAVGPIGSDSNYYNQIFSAGQSLSIGSQTSVSLSTTQPYNNKMLTIGSNGTSGGGMGNGTSFTSLIESGSTESPGSGIANNLTFNTSSSTVFVVTNNGVQGVNYLTLASGTAAYINGLTQTTNVRNAASSSSKVSRVTGVTVVHGETDNSEDMTAISASTMTHAQAQSTYEAYMVQWQSDYEASLKSITGQGGRIPMFMSQMSSWFSPYGKNPYPDIPLAQLAAAENNPGKIYMVAPKYFFVYSDQHHLTASSSRWLGEYYAKVIKKVTVDHEAWRPLSTDSVYISGNIITANFHVPAGSLTFDTTIEPLKTNYGFEYSDSTNSASISSVSIVGTSTVQITLSSTPSGSDKRLRYAYSAASTSTNAGSSISGAAGGNLRDTDNYPSLYGNTLYNWAVHFDKAVVPLPDLIAPTLSSVVLSSNNASSTRAKVGDTVTLSFTSSETISTPSVTFLSGGVSITATTTATSTGDNWTVSYITNSSDTNGAITYTINYQDVASNAGVAVTSGSGSVAFDKTAPTLSSVVLSSNNATSTRAKVGDTVTLSFTSSETISTPTVTFSSSSTSVVATTTITNTSGNNWTATYVANTSDIAGAVTYSVSFSDLASNAGVAVTSGSGSVTFDKTAPTLSLVVLSSNNASSTRAKIGDVVTLSFSASEQIGVPVVSFSSGSVVVNGTTTATSTGNNWSVSYIVNSLDSNGLVTYNISFSDLASNSGTPVTSGTGSVTVDATAPTLSSVVLSSNNATSTRAKVGNTVTLSFTSSETITTPSVIFTSGGVSVTSTTTVSNISGNNWTVIYVTNISDTAGVVAYTISFSDISSNAGISVTSGTGSVTFDKTAPILSSVSIVSNNTVTSKAKPGDIITLSFSSSEQIQTPTVSFTIASSTVAGSVINSNISLNNWTASYTTSSTDSNGTINFSINYQDLAYNSGTAVTSGSGSVTFDKTAPTILEVTPVASSTTDSTPDYEFSSDEVGSITYGGSCSSTATTTIIGTNTITFSALSDATYSNCTITVTDATGNASSALAVSTFSVQTNGPQFTSITANPSSTSSVITWTTNQSSDTSVSYGLDTSIVHTTTSTDSGGVLSHSVTISSLASCTKYYYAVHSTNLFAASSTSATDSFITTGCTGGSTITSSALSGQITTGVGGSVSLVQSGDGVTLTIPISFSTNDAYFQIHKLASAPVIALAGYPASSSRAVTNYFYEFRALSTSSSIISTFDSSHPITVKIDYSSSDITSTDESSLVIYRYDGAGWIALDGCSVDTVGDSISCTTDHFSAFALFGNPASSSSSSTTSRGSGRSLRHVYPTSISGKQLDFTINSGQTTTTSTNVSITMNANPETVSGYSVSLNSSFIYEGFHSYKPNINFEIPEKNGTYKIYLKYYSPTGYPSAVISHEITYKSPGNSDTSISSKSKIIFKRNLKLGMSGSDVKELQKFLNSQGFIVAKSGAGSPGKENTSFGRGTQKAVIAFQNAHAKEVLAPYGYTTGTGIFGSLSIALANQLLSK